jgi:hypothetical protein
MGPPGAAITAITVTVAGVAVLVAGLDTDGTSTGPRCWAQAGPVVAEQGP